MSKEILLVTGATGLVGSNVCLMAAEAGYTVRAMVRSMATVDPLRQPGIEIVQGDVTDRASLLRAAEGASGIIHTAAVLGGTWSKTTPEEFWAVNYHGVVNVMEAAKQRGVRRVVDLDTLAILDWSYTLTEHSPIAPIMPGDSHYVASKRASIYESLHRAALGQDIVFVTPAGIYGPGVFPERALHPTCFNSTLEDAINGKLDRYVKFPLLWVYVDDVARISLAALDKGSIGSRYLALGRPEDACSLAGFCNLGAEIAGVSQRVEDIDLATGGAEIGTMAKLASRKYGNPMMDATATNTALGIEPTSLAEGLSHTVRWLREQGRI